MNSIEAVSIMSPHGKTEDCAKFVIEDNTFAYHFPDRMLAGYEYTFSCWIRSESTGSITVGTTTHETSEEWTYRTFTFVSDSNSLVMIFPLTGTYYIYHAQLELGNRATDWTPAPEDVDQAITDSENKLKETITEQSTSFLETSEEITMTALESYVRLTDYGAFRDHVESELSVQADKIEMKFDTISNQINETNGELESEISQRTKHITFSENGIVLTAGENAMSIRIDNDIVVFEKGGVQFGWWDGVDFHTGNIMIETTERAQFGNFAFVPRSDGSLSFLKVDSKAGFHITLSGGIMRIYGAYPVLEETTMVISDIPAELNETTLVMEG